MPSAAEILAGLTTIANEARWAAVAWHVVIAIALIALVRGWRPSQRLGAILLAVPLASVSGVAFAFGNPFNGVLFAIGTVALVAFAVRGRRACLEHGPLWARNAGLVMIAIGWAYPHFLAGSPIAYLYAAPVGLVPCPTLSVVMGFALLGAYSVPRAWTIALAALGLFYGAFGVFRLGVPLDACLLAGATMLLVSTSHSGEPVDPRPFARI